MLALGVVSLLLLLLLFMEWFDAGWLGDISCGSPGNWPLFSRSRS